MSTYTNYNEYINERLKNTSWSYDDKLKNTSWCCCQYDASYLIDKCGATEDFCLLKSSEEKLYVYTCKVTKYNGKYFFYIDEICEKDISTIVGKYKEKGLNECYDINRSEYIYDENKYNERGGSQELSDSLSEIVNDIPYIVSCQNIFVIYQKSEFRPLLYAIQEKSRERGGLIKVVRKQGGYSPEAGISFPSERKSLVATNVKLSLHDFACNEECVYVPLCEDTLDSVFFEDWKWRDIIPDSKQKDPITIGDVNFEILKIKVQYDVFRNIFLYVVDALDKDRKKCLLIKNVHCKNENLVNLVSCSDNRPDTGSGLYVGNSTDEQPKCIDQYTPNVIDRPIEEPGRSDNIPANEVAHSGDNASESCRNPELEEVVELDIPIGVRIKMQSIASAVQNASDLVRTYCIRPYVIGFLTQKFPNESWKDMYGKVIPDSPKYKLMKTNWNKYNTIEFGNFIEFLKKYKDDIDKGYYYIILNNASNLKGIRNTSSHAYADIVGLGIEHLSRAFTSMKELAEIFNEEIYIDIEMHKIIFENNFDKDVKYYWKNDPCLKKIYNDYEDDRKKELKKRS